LVIFGIKFIFHCTISEHVSISKGKECVFWGVYIILVSTVAITHRGVSSLAQWLFISWSYHIVMRGERREDTVSW